MYVCMDGWMEGKGREGKVFEIRISSRKIGVFGGGFWGGEKGGEYLLGSLFSDIECIDPRS